MMLSFYDLTHLNYKIKKAESINYTHIKLKEFLFN